MPNPITTTTTTASIVPLLFLLLPSLSLATSISSPQWGSNQQYPPSTPPYCADGGELHCCEITFNGGNSAVVAASDLACYDLTPATINCVIASDPFTNGGGTCNGNYACCQVNDLVPLLGLFCSDPPGGCVGPAEGNGECTDILSNGDGFRFGQCGKNDVRNIRGLLGLSVGDVDIKKREEVVEKREALLEGKRRELVEMVRMGEL